MTAKHCTAATSFTNDHRNDRFSGTIFACSATPFGWCGLLPVRSEGRFETQRTPICAFLETNKTLQRPRCSSELANNLSITQMFSCLLVILNNFPFYRFDGSGIFRFNGALGTASCNFFSNTKLYSTLSTFERPCCASLNFGPTYRSS